MFNRRTCAIMDMVLRNPEAESDKVPPSMSSENESIIVDISHNYVVPDDNVVAVPTETIAASQGSGTSHPEKNVITGRNVMLTETDISVSSPPPSPEDPYATDRDPDDEDYTVSTVENSSSDTDMNASVASTSERVAEEDEHQENENTGGSRKRKRNPEMWRRNVIKRSRNKGLAYTTWRGKKQPTRALKPPCVNCRTKCTEKISTDVREEIFRQYWDLGDVNRQRDFISKFVVSIQTRRNRRREKLMKNGGGNEEQQNDTHTIENVDATESRRQFTLEYYLNNASGHRTRVCKTFFLNTLSISGQVVKTVVAKTTSTGAIVKDKRGKAQKNSKLNEGFKDHVRAHINSFETMESHYCRKKTKRLYLPPSLNITKMYNLFLEYCEENNITDVATQSMYREIFNTEFNFSFFIPKKDLCDICNQYDTSDVEQKRLLQGNYDTHISDKNTARDLKNSDKERAIADTTFCAAVFDLQQILPVPKSEVGLCYYKLKLNTFNFTVYNLVNKDCFCFMWHECTAKRGSSEIGSCLSSFIQHHLEQGVTEFSLYSDNCAGQNRNKYLFSLYNYLTQKYKVIIRHTYLERGHTQNEGDSVHSTIENASRHIPIYSPDQWYTLVRTARRKQPYIVKELSREDIFDLKSLQMETTINWDKDEENERVSWLKIKIVECRPNSPNILFFKYDYGSVISKRINLLEKGRRKITPLDAANRDYFKVLYTAPIPLKKKKFDHLQYLCKKVIKPQYHYYFNDLPHTNRECDSQSESE